MPTKARGKGLVALVLVFLVITGTLSFILIYNGPAACIIGCQTTTQYNGAGSTHSLKTIGTNGATQTQILNGGSIPWPIGSAYQQFSVSGPLNQFGSWIVTMPGDQSFGSGSSYVFQESTSGTALLNNANNAGLWAAEGSALNGQNPYVFNQTYASSVSAPSACNTASTTNVCKVTWFLNRYYFTIDMKTAGAALYIACAPGTTCQGYTNILTLSNKAAYDAAFQAAFQTVYSNVNSAMHLSQGTSLSLQLTLPQLPGGQSNLDFAGIIAAWTATPCTGGSSTPQGGGTGTGDLCTTGCGAPAGCSIVQSTVHNPLPLYTDGALTSRYLPSCLTYLNVPSYSASQLAGACANSISGSVYTKLDLTDFGAGISQPGPGTFSNCGISSFSSCWSVTQPEAVLTVMLDVLTSYHVFQPYPTPPPPTQTSAGSITGQVIDGSIPLYKPGVAGATICLTDISGCVVDDAGGNFNIPNVAAGQHTIQVTAPGYFATAPITVSVNSGTAYNVGQISLAPQNPWYSGCWQIVAPAYPGAFQICIPYVLVFSIIAAAVIALVAYGYLATRPAQTAAQVAKGITFNGRRQRGYHVSPID